MSEFDRIIVKLTTIISDSRSSIPRKQWAYGRLRYISNEALNSTK